MKKLFVFVSVFILLGSCNSRRQLQEERESDSPTPTEERSLNGREMGGGGGNR